MESFTAELNAVAGRTGIEEECGVLGTGEFTEMKPTPEQIVKALQYLYYTSDGINRLGGSPVSDWRYDAFCGKHGIEGNGASDLEKDYDKWTVALAERIAEVNGFNLLE